MAKCDNCIHHGVCDENRERNHRISKSVCKHFKDKDLIVELPCKPMPVITEHSHSDAYCPFCGENISGYYGGHNAPDILPCLFCGEWLDNTKSMSREEAEQALNSKNT